MDSKTLIYSKNKVLFKTSRSSLESYGFHHGTHEGAGWPKAFQIGHPGAENKEKAEFIQQQALTHDTCEVKRCDLAISNVKYMYICCLYF
jgi:hypothetical protein